MRDVEAIADPAGVLPTNDLSDDKAADAFAGTYDWLLQSNAQRDSLRESLRRVARIEDMAEELQLVLVRRLRRDYALTWRELGEDLGLVPQTAHRRFAAKIRR
ncbi:MAG TPA: hypothetical protein VH950_03795 [Gaiellaceae bacterium]|jgi:hypothetical protein